MNPKEYTIITKKSLMSNYKKEVNIDNNNFIKDINSSAK